MDIDQDVRRVTSLLASLSIQVTKEWLEGCIRYFREENPRSEFSALMDFVRNQWLLSDLREISVGCLPSDLPSQVKTTLNGKYTLQVEFIINVGESAYSQIQKLRKADIENVTATEKPSENWIPKGRRVLMMSLCDGHQTIKGLEFKPLPMVHEFMTPGLKVTVTGPVECRRGVLLLKPQNLEVLDGEVDTLLVKNCTENVLARILKLPENRNPVCFNGASAAEDLPRVNGLPRAQAEVRESTRHVGAAPRTVPVQAKSQLDCVPTHVLEDVNAEDWMDTDFVETTNNETELNHHLSPQRSSSLNRQLIKHPPSKRIKVSHTPVNSIDSGYYSVSSQENINLDDGTETDLSSNVGSPYHKAHESINLDDQLSRKQFVNAAASSRANSVPTAKSLRKEVTNHSLTLSETQKQSGKQQSKLSLQQPTKWAGFLDLEKQKVVPKEESIKYARSPVAVALSSPSSTLTPPLAALLLSTSSHQSPPSVSHQSGRTNLLSSSGKNSSLVEMVENEVLMQRTESVSVNKTKHVVLDQHRKRNPLQSTSSFDRHENVKYLEDIDLVEWEDVALQCTSGSRLAARGSNSEDTEDCGRAEVCSANGSVTKNTNKGSQAVLSSSSDSSICSMVYANREKVKDNDLTAGQSTKDLTSAMMPGNSFVSKTLSGSFSTVAQRCELNVKEHTTDEKPCFSYLFRIKKLKVSKGTYRVRATISTLLTRLSVTNSREWSLRAVICDGTGTLDVMFSPEVLNEVIGFSAVELKVMKKEMNENPLKKDRLLKALQDSQQKFIDLCCLFDIKFEPDHIPQVIAVHELSTSYLNEMESTINGD